MGSAARSVLTVGATVLAIARVATMEAPPVATGFGVGATILGAGVVVTSVYLENTEYCWVEEYDFEETSGKATLEAKKKWCEVLHKGPCGDPLAEKDKFIHNGFDTKAHNAAVKDCPCESSKEETGSISK